MSMADITDIGEARSADRLGGWASQGWGGICRSRSWILGILALIALLNTMDQAILGVTLPAIQTAFRLADSQVGLLSGAFVIVYGLAVLPAGAWVDRRSRHALIALGVALWSACTLMTGLARSYPQLLAARMVLGIGEATTLPASVSLLGDLFTKRERGRAAGALQAALQFGLALGLIGGGVVAARLGWRAAFYVAALPGLLLAVAAGTLREPQRGAAEARGAFTGPARRVEPGAVRRLLCIRSLVAGVLANSFVLFASTGVGGFIALYTTRRFGIDLARVGALVGIPLLLGGLVGNTVGGWLVDRRGHRPARAPLEIAAAASVLGAVGLVATFTARTPAAFAAAFLCATLAANAGLPGLLAINQNVVLPPLRGTATALQQLVGNLLGRALGLVLIGAVSEHLHDLRLALLVLAPGALVLAAVCAALGLARLPRDVRTMEREWATLASG